MPTRSRAAAVCDATGADGADVSWAASPSASACATGRRGAEPGSAVEILSIAACLRQPPFFFSFCRLRFGAWAGVKNVTWHVRDQEAEKLRE